MDQGRGRWIAGGLAVTAAVIVALAAVSAGGEPGGQDGGTEAEVINVTGVEQLQAAFEADNGHPRLILLVDPL